MIVMAIVLLVSLRGRLVVAVGAVIVRLALPDGFTRGRLMIAVVVGGRTLTVAVMVSVVRFLSAVVPNALGTRQQCLVACFV